MFHGREATAPSHRQVRAGLRRLRSEDMGASRSGRIPPAANPKCHAHPAQDRAPVQPSEKRVGAGWCSREAPRLQDTRCPPAICRRHAPCNDLAAETHPSLLRCLTPSPSDCLTARGSAALARQRGTGRGRAASQGHAAPWAWAMERHGWSRAPFHLHPTLRGLVRLL